jgi:hypothetical protein
MHQERSQHFGMRWTEQVFDCTRVCRGSRKAKAARRRSGSPTTPLDGFPEVASPTVSGSSDGAAVSPEAQVGVDRTFASLLSRPCPAAITRQLQHAPLTWPHQSTLSS